MLKVNNILIDIGKIRLIELEFELLSCIACLAGSASGCKAHLLKKALEHFNPNPSIKGEGEHCRIKWHFMYHT